MLAESVSAPVSIGQNFRPAWSAAADSALAEEATPPSGKALVGGRVGPSDGADAGAPDGADAGALDGGDPGAVDAAEAGPGDSAAAGPWDAVADAVDTRAFGGPRLLQRDLIRMFSQSRISLGFATAGDSHLGVRRLTHLRLREFEAPMSGALYLTEDQPELAEYFVPGAEVLTYTDHEDLLDKVRYFLGHQEQAERIRRAGLQRARRYHTWQHRFTQLFAELGIRPR